MGRVKEDVAPPQEIRAVPHKAWQAPGVPCTEGTREDRHRDAKRTAEIWNTRKVYGPYRNPWFLMKKKNGMYRRINAALTTNAATIRDANLPPVADDFVEEFTGV